MHRSRCCRVHVISDGNIRVCILLVENLAQWHRLPRRFQMHVPSALLAAAAAAAPYRRRRHAQTVHLQPLESFSHPPTPTKRQQNPVMRRHVWHHVIRHHGAHNLQRRLRVAAVRRAVHQNVIRASPGIFMMLPQHLERFLNRFRVFLLPVSSHGRD